MRRFKFRAQAALDLRQRQYDEATRRSAAARAAADSAGARVTAAEQALVISLQRAHDATSQIDTPHVWHRNWIVGLRFEIVRCKQVHQERETEASASHQRTLLAYRKLRSLEQLRTRLEQAHAAEEQHVEQRELDEFSSVRFASRFVREEEAR